ncbi:MAG: thiamine-phosphate kinase [Thaumarchaeota archaeon]|nr:thiamine-phosphate kinase [Nitrososphaerota archaeon]
MPKLDETEIIKTFVKVLGHPKKPFSRIGDDVAYFPRGKELLVLKNDMLVGKTDVPNRMELWQAARKAVIMCASDILVKGARPICFMLSFGIPRSYSAKDIESLAKGVKVARDELGVDFLGGDTNECDDLVIDCIMLGNGESITSRAGAKVGDYVYVSGEFGLPSAGLKIMQDLLKAKASFKEKAIRSVLLPSVKPRLASILKNNASASIDSSDGLALSLYQMAEASNVSIHLQKVPIANGLEEFSKANNLRADELALYGGEEYEMVFCAGRGKAKKFEQACSKAGSSIIRIGIVKKGEGVYLKGKRLERRGWIHFRPDVR